MGHYSETTTTGGHLTIIGLVSLRHDAESVSASGLTKKKKKKVTLLQMGRKIRHRHKYENTFVCVRGVCSLCLKKKKKNTD